MAARESAQGILGIRGSRTLAKTELIGEKYRGIRPAPGYPACPDHTAKAELFRLLDAPANTGMALTENFAMATDRAQHPGSWALAGAAAVNSHLQYS